MPRVRASSRTPDGTARAASRTPTQVAGQHVLGGDQRHPGIELDHGVPGVGEQRHGTFQRRLLLPPKRRHGARRRVPRHRDPQRRQRLVEPCEVRAPAGRGRAAGVRGRRRPVDSRRPRVCAGVQEPRGRGHVTRQRAEVRHPVPVVGQWRERHQPARRLEPDEAAPGRRDADRAGAVGAVRHPDHAGGHRGGRTTGGAAGSAVERPRVAGRAVVQRLGERPHHQLGNVRLADDHRAGHAQPPDHLAVGRCRLVPGRVRAVARGVAGEVRVVLDRDRHAEQRRVLAGVQPHLRRAGRGPCLVLAHHTERVDPRLHLAQPCEHRVEQGRRGHLTRAQRARLGIRTGPQQLVHARHASAPCG